MTTFTTDLRKQVLQTVLVQPPREKKLDSGLDVFPELQKCSYAQAPALDTVRLHSALGLQLLQPHQTFLEVLLVSGCLTESMPHSGFRS